MATSPRPRLAQADVGTLHGFELFILVLTVYSLVNLVLLLLPLDGVTARESMKGGEVDEVRTEQPDDLARRLDQLTGELTEIKCLLLLPQDERGRPRDVDAPAGPRLRTTAMLGHAAPEDKS